MFGFKANSLGTRRAAASGLLALAALTGMSGPAQATIASATIASCSVGSNAQLVSGSTVTVNITLTANQTSWDTVLTTNGTATFISNIPVNNFTANVPLAVTFTLNQAPLGGLFSVYDGGNSISLSCGNSAATTSSSPSASSVIQQINNAQFAITKGLQTLQTLNNWISKSLFNTFSNKKEKGYNVKGVSTEAPQSRPGAMAKVEQLRAREKELREELAEQGDDAGTLKSSLQATRTELAYATLSARIAGPTTRGASLRTASARAPGQSTPESAVPAEPAQSQLSVSSTSGADLKTADGADATTDRSAPRPQMPTCLSLDGNDLRNFCAAGGEACDVLGERWNVWLEGRVIGAVDSLANTNSLGFLGSTGVDYKVLPWLAVGLSAGIEGFETRFSGWSRTGSFGYTVMPYIGVELDEHFFASAFAGVSSIAYNTNPSAGVMGTFNALRFLFGGALTGTWREGPWRLQPALYGTYGTERQNGYTDSSGTAVAAQTLSYGRIGAGPEVGYTFRPGDGAFTVEPFATIRANLDFASSNSTVLNGQSVVLRPGTLGSGSAGIGLNLVFDSGVFLRAQGSYDSIGVAGLDVWSGILRGGMAF